MIQYLSRLFYILTGKRWQLLLIAALCFFTSLLETIGIGLIGPFIAIATNPGLIQTNSLLKQLYTVLSLTTPLQFIACLGLTIITILWCKAILGFTIQKHIFSFGFGLQADLRTKLLKAYLSVPYTFHLSRNTANLIQTIITETTSFANLYLMPMLFLGSHLTVVIALMILLLKTDLYATFSVAMALLVIGSFLYRYKQQLSLWGKQGHDSEVNMIRIINHALGGIKETRVLGCETYFQAQLMQQANVFKEVVTAANAFSLIPRYTLEPLLVTFVVCFTMISLLLNRSPQTLIATLGVFGMSAARMLPAATGTMQSLGTMRQYSYIVNRLYIDLKEIETGENEELIEKPNLNYIPAFFIDSPITERTLSFQNTISLNHITYSYPGVSQVALKDVSLVIERGRSIGLIGKSGAGKTTLVDILLGLLIPEDGEIRVDGVPVTTTNLREWQQLIGYIPQSIFLMDDTVERNIAFGIPDEEIDLERMEKAIQSAQLVDLVEQLPDGIQTIIGERGVRLSGGQRQRIGIARALYYEREVLVLDEATAALDNETESLVTESIKALSGAKTIIIIAHRLSTLEHCNQIYQLDAGRVINSGTYQEVVLSR